MKERELQLVAAKNYLLPRLDAVASYTWNGMDQEQLGQDDTAFGAYQNMLHGDYQSWHLGLQATVPIGFRKEMAGVRNAQQSLAREKAKLQEEELEVSHQVAYAMRDMESNLVVAQTDFNRVLAAEKEVDAVRRLRRGQIILDVLLEAQRNLADAESAYYRVLVNYNVAIAQVHYRKGSLLEYNGVCLAEGPWPGKAYFDARRRPGPAMRPLHQLRLHAAGADQPRADQPAGRLSADGGSARRIRSGGSRDQQGNQSGDRADARDDNRASADADSGARAAPITAAAPLPTPDNAAPKAAGKKTDADEPLENPPTAETDQSASGWKRVQR